MLQLCNSEVIDNKFQPISLDLGFIFTAVEKTSPMDSMCSMNYVTRIIFIITRSC